MKKSNLFLGIGLGLCLIGGGVGIGYSIKNTQTVNQLQSQLNDETEESKIEQLKQKINELMNNNLVKSIVSYSTTVASAVGLIVTLVKYKNVKALTTEQMTTVASNVCADRLKKIEEKLLKSLIEKFGNVEDAMAEVVTVMAMMQDTTTKGKQALIEYLAKRTKENDSVSEEAKEIVEEVKESINSEVEKEEELKEEVQKDYQSVAIE